GPEIVLPATSTVPVEAWTRPPIMLSRVDLPQPLGPMRQTISPFMTSSETLSSVLTAPLPYEWETSLTLMATSARAGAFWMAAFMSMVSFQSRSYGPGSVGAACAADAAPTALRSARNGQELGGEQLLVGRLFGEDVHLDEGFAQHVHRGGIE